MLIVALYTIGTANGTIGITIGTNGITNGTIGKTLNDIGIPLVPLGNPERTQYTSILKCWFLVGHLGPGHFGPSSEELIFSTKYVIS